MVSVGGTVQRPRVCPKQRIMTSASLSIKWVIGLPLREAGPCVEGSEGNSSVFSTSCFGIWFPASNMNPNAQTLCTRSPFSQRKWCALTRVPKARKGNLANLNYTESPSFQAGERWTGADQVQTQCAQCEGTGRDQSVTRIRGHL